MIIYGKLKHFKSHAYSTELLFSRWRRMEREQSIRGTQEQVHLNVQQLICRVSLEIVVHSVVVCNCCRFKRQKKKTNKQKKFNKKKQKQQQQQPTPAIEKFSFSFPCISFEFFFCCFFYCHLI